MIFATDGAIHLGLNSPADWLRMWVLLQVVVVVALDLEAMLRTVRGFRRDRPGSPLRVLRAGRAARFVAVLASCALIAWDVLHRLGLHHIDPRTPIAQVALFGWLVAYYLVDRRDYKDAEQGLDELLTAVQGREVGRRQRRRRA